MARGKKNKKDITSKLLLFGIELLKISALNYRLEDESETIKLLNKSDYKIVDLSEKEVAIQLSTEFMFEPKIPFTISMDILIKYKILESINENEINSSIEELLSPCGSTISLIVGFITEKMVGVPLIVPPVVNIAKDKVQV